MKRSPKSIRRGEGFGRPQGYRPALECMERRLPPGYALASPLLGPPALDLNTAEQRLIDPANVFGIDDQQQHEIVRRRPDANAESAVEHSQEQRRDETTSETFDFGTKSPRFTRIGYPGWAPNTASVGTVFSTTGASNRGVVDRQSIPSRAQFGAAAIGTGKSADQVSNSQVPTEKSEILNSYGKLPLSFEQNIGQFDERVDFVSRAVGSTVFLTPTAAVFAISEPEALTTTRDRPTVADASGSEERAHVSRCT